MVPPPPRKYAYIRESNVTMQAVGRLLILIVLCVSACQRPFLAAPPMITDDQLNSMELPFRVGDEVRALRGPFANHRGRVVDVNGFTGVVLYKVELRSGQLSDFEATALTLQKSDPLWRE